MNGTELIRHRCDRIATAYDALDALQEIQLLRWERPYLLQNVLGKVLEVGIGTGKNLPFYPAGVELVGIDFSACMLEQARRRAARLGCAITLHEMNVESLSFADDSFDFVVSTCVFCTVPDPIAGLREIRRVCKPGGFILMLERVRSERALLGRLMDWLNFIPLHLYGANINRRTLENLRCAGFNHIQSECVSLDVVKRIYARNDKEDLPVTPSLFHGALCDG